MNNETEHSVDEHNATLNRLAAIGEVSAGIAHEIRNPLTAVKGFLQLMERDYPSPHWSVVQSELEQAIGTVHELLSVSKPNLVTEPKRQFSLCAIIENILSLLHKEMYRVKVHKRFHHTKAMVYGKQNQVKRAIFNLRNRLGTIGYPHHFENGMVLRAPQGDMEIPQLLPRQFSGDGRRGI